MSKALYEVVSSKFHDFCRIALFFDYKDVCKCDKDISKKLRELNRYDSINVALVLRDSNDKLDDDAKKLTIIDMPNRKIRYTHKDSYKLSVLDGMNEAVNHLVKEWYRGPVFVMFFCGKIKSKDLCPLACFENPVTIKIVSSNALDRDADECQIFLRSTKLTIETFIDFARKRR